LKNLNEELSRSVPPRVHEIERAEGSIFSPEGQTLPASVDAYFTADRADAEAVADCFTESAIVKDEGRTHQGREAIKNWKEEVSTTFEYTCEPLKCETTGGQCVVTCRLARNFPGSPADLRFFFELEGEKIASLTVIP
jgi:hypothetical protein